MLVAEAGLTEAEQADACLALAAIRTPDAVVRRPGARARREHPLLDEGLTELARVVEGAARGSDPGSVVADLRIARGLDYYTGTVYETQLRRPRAPRRRSAPAAATTRWPATAARPTRASASRSG